MNCSWRLIDSSGFQRSIVIVSPPQYSAAAPEDHDRGSPSIPDRGDLASDQFSSSFKPISALDAKPHRAERRQGDVDRQLAAVRADRDGLDGAEVALPA